MRRFLLLAALALAPAAAAAETFSVPLADLVGEVDFPTSGPGKGAYFDFEQRFSEVHDVWIEVDAHVFAREFDVCGTTFNPQPCVHEVQLLGFFARMDEEEFAVPGTVTSEGLSFGDLSALEGSGVDVAIFKNTQVGWDFLLDGEGSLLLFWNSILGNPDRIIENVVQPFGEIFDARLIVEATPAPEPSPTLLFSSALVVLARMRARMRKVESEVRREAEQAAL